MQHLTHAPEIQESKALEYIFLASRANESRETKFVHGHCLNFKVVTFTLLADGTHEACLENTDGVVIAMAIVDQFDI